MVLLESLLWIADRPNDSCLQILLPADVIDHAIVDRVEEQTVNGEVAALGVFLSRGEPHAGWMPAVVVRHIGAKSGDFDLTSVQPHQDHAKRRADGLRV